MAGSDRRSSSSSSSSSSQRNSTVSIHDDDDHQQSQASGSHTSTRLDSDNKHQDDDSVESLPLTSPTTLLSPPPRLTPHQLQLPTTYLYAQRHNKRSIDHQSNQGHYGSYVQVRRELDWNYHELPTKQRQLLQDQVVKAVLRRIQDTIEHVHVATNASTSNKKEPVAYRSEDQVQAESGVGDGQDNNGIRIGGSSEEAEIRARMKLEEMQDRQQGIKVEGRDERVALFTAGGMGAGKGHTLRHLLKDGTVKLAKDFVWVDPDSLARSLPEREQYIRNNHKTASKLLHPEAAMLQEILSGVAKHQKRTLVVDGSLSDCGWFGKLMKRYRKDGYECEILFVTAPEDTMISRAERRAKITGRFTDPEAIKFSRLKSPECVSRLSTPEHVRRVRLIDNSSDSVPPTILYDSNLDPDWQAAAKLAHSSTTTTNSSSTSLNEILRHNDNDNDSDEEEGCSPNKRPDMVDVKAFVEGRAKQRKSDGKVIQVDDPKAELERRKQGITSSSSGRL
ncbi:hypothetical protein OIO90_004328 [Microbotryomycetes sp. JL221]|nr:hypothetical protein OIO90_004328 [Microbotryomycetes sp. JL221]